jgi:hypothetical protein
MPPPITDRRDPSLTTASASELVTPADIGALHEWPDPPPKENLSDEPITVGLMDSGISREVLATHPWFEGAEFAGRRDFTGQGVGDEVGHGTGVASLISRLGGPVRFWDLRIFGESGATGLETVQRAYQFLISRAGSVDVANFSWGATSNVMHVNRLHEALIAAGVVDVVSAGNTGSDGGSPATTVGAFSAGAVGEGGTPLRFSSFDPDKGYPDVAAVGENVKMAAAPGAEMGQRLSGPYVKESGTSFSAPITTAAYCHLLRNSETGEDAPSGTGQAASPESHWDERLREAAPDIEGTARDGAGLLIVAPLLPEDPAGEEPPDEEAPEEEPPEEEPPDEESPDEEPPDEEEDAPPTDEPTERSFKQTPAESMPDDARFSTYRARLYDVIDADTIDLVVDLGFHATRIVRVEIAGIDAAEIYGVSHESDEYEQGKAQLEKAENFFREAREAAQAKASAQAEEANPPGAHSDGGQPGGPQRTWPLGVVIRGESGKACRWNAEVFRRHSSQDGEDTGAEHLRSVLVDAFPEIDTEPENA